MNPPHSRDFQRRYTCLGGNLRMNLNVAHRILDLFWRTSHCARHHGIILVVGLGFVLEANRFRRCMVDVEDKSYGKKFAIFQLSGCTVEWDGDLALVRGFHT
ncbi:hypothetical protein TNCV_202011 [Trichonephila clavipes]|nr:hypothetical protein TNCV_202011 [Trichonephila clavipes]